VAGLFYPPLVSFRQAHGVPCTLVPPPITQGVGMKTTAESAIHWLGRLATSMPVS